MRLPFCLVPCLLLSACSGQLVRLDPGLTAHAHAGRALVRPAANAGVRMARPKTRRPGPHFHLIPPASNTVSRLRAAGEYLQEPGIAEPDSALVSLPRPAFAYGYGAPEIVGTDRLAADAELLFATLRHGYAGYGYFGGDARFGSARAALAAALAAAPGREMTISNFTWLLGQHLSFVRDGHFAIGAPFGPRFLPERREAVSAPLPLVHTNGHWYWHGGDRPQPVTNTAALAALRPSLDGEGAPAWRAWVRVEAPAGLPGSLELLLGDGTRQAVPLFPLAPGGPVVPYRRDTVDGFPVVRIGALTDAAEAAGMHRDAAALRNEPVIILDLRGNGGGSDLVALRWLEALDEPHSGPGRWSRNLGTRTSSALLRNLGQGGHGTGGWGWIGLWRSRAVRGRRCLFVLTDGRIGSSAETFVALLRTSDTVVILGSPTAGIGVTGNIGAFQLPASLVQVRLGTTLSLWEDGRDREGIGLEPDLWLDPAAAETLAIRAARRYAKAIE